MKDNLKFIATLFLVGFAVWAVILVGSFAYWVGF